MTLKAVTHVYWGKLAISRKQREIWCRLLLITNRKWHMPLQMKWKSSTFDDLQGYDNQCGRPHPKDSWDSCCICVCCTPAFLCTSKLLFQSMIFSTCSAKQNTATVKTTQQFARVFIYCQCTVAACVVLCNRKAMRTGLQSSAVTRQGWTDSGRIWSRSIRADVKVWRRNMHIRWSSWDRNLPTNMSRLFTYWWLLH